MPRGSERLQHAQHRDGVGRGDQGSEEQAVKRRQAEVQRAGEQPAEPADDARREEGADDGQDPDADPVLAQVAELDVERPAKSRNPSAPCSRSWSKSRAARKRSASTLIGG